ncbi:MAG: hypothetical protein WBR29_07490 [Gammaproteobacteria bacterium]
MQWLRTFSNYDPVNYTLSYALMPTTGSIITITAVDYGDHATFEVNVAGATTEAWVPSDNYIWQAYMKDGSGNRTTLFNGRIKIKPDFATAAVANYQSAVKQTLDALYALVQNKASSDQMNYTIRGRSLSRMTPKEILDWIDFYEELFDREKRSEAIAQGKGNKGKIVVRFRDLGDWPMPNLWWRGGGY